MLGSDEPILHLVHPYTVPWDIITNTASDILDVPIIPYKEWVSKLHVAAKDADSEAPKRNPAIKLLQFFENDLAEESNIVIATEKAVAVSPTLRMARKLRREDVEMWIGYWKTVGLLR